MSKTSLKSQIMYLGVELQKDIQLRYFGKITILMMTTTNYHHNCKLDV